jgi:hypothetical protein
MRAELGSLNAVPLGASSLRSGVPVILKAVVEIAVEA